MANLKFYKKNTRPATGVQGGVYFIKDEGKIYIYNNEWEDYVVTADKLKGFSERGTNLTWGALQDQDVVTRLSTYNNSEIAFTEQYNSLNCQINGAFYQNEGAYKVLDENSIKTTPTKEAYLEWGGKNINGSWSPIDASLNSNLGANRFAFFPDKYVTVEYSRDSGVTWTDCSDTSKTKYLFCGRHLYDDSIAYRIGNNTTNANPDITKYQLRITMNFIGVLYTEINKFHIYLATNGSARCWVTLQNKIGDADYTNLITKQIVNGWSSENVLNTHIVVGSPNYYTNYIRFIFGCDAINTAEPNYPGLTIYNIFGFGGIGWNTQSYMSRYGNLYSWDENQNALFPAQVNATQFNGTLQGNAATATQASSITWEEYS